MFIYKINKFLKTLKFERNNIFNSIMNNEKIKNKFENAFVSKNITMPIFNYKLSVCVNEMKSYLNKIIWSKTYDHFLQYS
jgi:hypothetical protein